MHNNFSLLLTNRYTFTNLMHFHQHPTYYFQLHIIYFSTYRKCDILKSDTTTTKCNELWEKALPSLCTNTVIIIQIGRIPDPPFSTSNKGKTHTFDVINFLALICSDLIRNRPCQLKRLERNKITIRREDLGTHTWTNAVDLLKSCLDDAQIGDIYRTMPAYCESKLVEI